MAHQVLGRPPEGHYIQFVSGPLDCRRANLRVRARYKNKHGEVSLWRRYEIDQKRYDEMLAAQGGVCAICKRAPEEKIQVRGSGKVPATQRKLQVGHCHRTGRVRLLLCWSCNTGLGHFADDLELLRAAAQYLDAANPFALSS